MLRCNPGSRSSPGRSLCSCTGSRSAPGVNRRGLLTGGGVITPPLVQAGRLQPGAPGAYVSSRPHPIPKPDGSTSLAHPGGPSARMVAPAPFAWMVPRELQLDPLPFESRAILPGYTSPVSGSVTDETVIPPDEPPPPIDNASHSVRSSNKRLITRSRPYASLTRATECTEVLPTDWAVTARKNELRVAWIPTPNRSQRSPSASLESWIAALVLPADIIGSLSPTGWVIVTVNATGGTQR